MTLPPPFDSFESKGGRRFTVGAGEHTPERFPGDTFWSDSWPIEYDGKPAGTLSRNLNYGLTADGKPRWQASTRKLYWSRAGDAPTGIGFDVAPFDTADECLAAWARSADQILDWSEGKPVISMYGRTEARRGKRRRRGGRVL